MDTATTSVSPATTSDLDTIASTVASNAIEIVLTRGRLLAAVKSTLRFVCQDQTWRANVRAAALVLAHAPAVPGVFRRNVDKARAIASGARPLSILGGPKVRAFYRALTGDESAAVIDVWTARAALARDVRVTDTVYALVARALALAATIARVQAAAWVAVRGRAT